MTIVSEMSSVIGVSAVCAVVGVARASYYRAQKALRVNQDSPATDAAQVGQEGALEAPNEVLDATTAVLDAAASPRKHVPRALTDGERSTVLALLHEERFVDQSPAEVYATLLDDGIYHCSERTLYRVLAANQEVKERRRQRRHPIYAAPELMADRPNQLWTWDITKLRGPAKGEYFHLYVIIDAYSRYVVGWMIAEEELAVLAKDFIDETCKRHGINRAQLTIHADRGTSMKSKLVALLLADLGVIKSHSRPSVSNDNPFSESHFKTLKYRPDFPDRFGSLHDARVHCASFFTWYNTRHHHVGIGLLTPHDVHFGLAEQLLAKRAIVLTAAFAAHPARFVNRAPRPAALPHAVWINKPKEPTTTDVLRQ